MLKTCNIIIVGGEGDLAFRKLYPALFSLHKQGLLADDTRVVCLGRGRFTEESFKENVRDWTEKSDYISEVSDDKWNGFSDRIIHFIGDATNPEDLRRLKSDLGPEEIVIYLSTPPSIFAPICKSMGEAGLVKDSTRLVVEKPLGESLESFNEINDSLFETFVEKQIYRIDHYLGKETVQNLLALRFANVLFQPLWDRNYIDHVQITVAESVGVGGRWNYYNDSGAMRDMVQNHLLQLVCLVAMEYPAKNTPDDVRNEKLKVLRSLVRINDDNVQENTVRGQYSNGTIDGESVLGYNEEADAKDKNSDTESFVAIKAEIENQRWAGVPFYLRTGKRMPERYSEIVIQFKPVGFKLFDVSDCKSEANSLVIRLQPNEGIQLNLMNKVPGLSEETQLQNVGLNLSFDDAFEDHRSPSAYERLLLDVTRGDQTLFMRSDELQEAWKWVDGIIKGWESTKQTVKQHAAGTAGPEDALSLLSRDNRSWSDYPN